MGEMTARQVLERERECVARQQCDRNCAQCDLVMEADDILAAYDHVLDILEAEEKTGMTPENVATIGRFREHIFSEWSYARMSEIAQAEHDGRLVVLPCKVGDTVYFITDKVNEAKILGVEMYDGKGWQVVLSTSGFIASTVQPCSMDEFGVTIFLTREEAEAALAKEECNHAAL